jgi:transcriptional regulator with XRE-family HTH domain
MDMQKLKALRQTHNYTQHQLAEMLKTTQQTVARWESGKAEPSIAMLRDLAMIFATSVDDILGKNPFSEKITSNILNYFGNEIITDKFWGHIGLLIPGQLKTKWFPITTDTAKYVSSSLKYREKEGWICITTLSNRILCINVTKIRRIWLLDDACDAPDDWGTDATEDYEGNPLEIYRGVDAYFSDDEDENENKNKNSFSTTYLKIISNFIEKKKLNRKNIYRFLHYTAIYMADGTLTSYWAEPENLYDIVSNIGIEFIPKILSIHECGGEFESYYPTDNLAVLEMPLIDVLDAAKAAEKELDDGELSGTASADNTHLESKRAE